jgi:hypothetical protein
MFFVASTAIAADLHQARALYHLLDQLPLTTKALEEVCETREAYALRRIAWVARNYPQQHLCPTRRQLINRAGVLAWKNHPSIRDAIESTLTSLQLSVIR